MALPDKLTLDRRQAPDAYRAAGCRRPPAMPRSPIRLAHASGLTVEQVLPLPVRPAAMPVTTRLVVNLGPNGSQPARRPRAAGRKPARGRVRQRRRLAVGRLRRAFAPAGARPLPLWLRRADDQPRAAAALCQRAGGRRRPATTSPNCKERIQDAIYRVLNYQSSSGSFGLWGPGSGDLWLDSYVTDFLTRAREKGYEVPRAGDAQAISNLQNSLAYDIDLQEPRLGDRLCALRARPQQEGVGRRPALLFRHAARGVLEPAGAWRSLPPALRSMATRSARRRPSRPRSSLPGRRPSYDWNRSDYGSQLRDGAAMLALAAESQAHALGGAGTDPLSLPPSAPGRGGPAPRTMPGCCLPRAPAGGQRRDQAERERPPHTGAFSTRVTGEELVAEPIVIANTGPIADPGGGHDGRGAARSRCRRAATASPSRAPTTGSTAARPTSPKSRRTSASSSFSR